jgi:hypothetical protein
MKIRYRNDGTVIVPDGTLHYNDHGERVIVRGSNAQHPNPRAMQELYSRAIRSQTSPEFDGQPDNPGARVVWTESIRIVCETNDHKLGQFVAYHADGREFGIVEDVALIRFSNVGIAIPRSPERNPHPLNRYRLGGTQSDTALTTTTIFRCAKCRLIFEKKMHTIGQKLFVERPEMYRLDHGKPDPFRVK